MKRREFISLAWWRGCYDAAWRRARSRRAVPSRLASWPRAIKPLARRSKALRQMSNSQAIYKAAT